MKMNDGKALVMLMRRCIPRARLLYRCIRMRVTAIGGLVHYAFVTCVRLHGGTWWAYPLMDAYQLAESKSLACYSTR